MDALSHIIDELEQTDPQNDGTMLLDDIRYCVYCGKPRQKKITWGGRERMVPCRCDCQMAEIEERRAREEEREQKIRVDRLRSLSMMPGKYEGASFAAFCLRPESERPYSAALKYAQNFREMEEKNQGLLFYGPVGTGKSYTAACIANYLMTQEIPVVMTSITKAMENWDDVQTAIQAARLLVIDDLGVERETDFAIERVYSLIDGRVRSNLPMVITTNISVREMLTCTDMRKKRIYDRVLEVCYPIEMVGRSIRLDTAAKRQAEMKKFFGGE